MGQTVSNVIESIQNDNQKQKLANDALNQMEELGIQQMDSFILRVINNCVDTKLIPVGQILHQHQIVRCNISSNTSDIEKEIATAFKSFVKDEMVKGIAKLLHDSIQALVCSYEGNKSEETIYTITTGDLGGIQRVDIRLFAWRYTSKQLMDITKDMITAAVIVSSADPKQITESSIRTLVQTQFGNIKKDKKKTDILSILLDAKKTSS